MIKYCALALIALSAVTVMRGVKSEFAGFAALASAVLLLGAAVSAFTPVLEYVKEITEGTAFGEYMGVLMKALGITVAVRFCSEICRDSGENALASKLELVGKAEIMLLCLPLVSELTELARKIMEI